MLGPGRALGGHRPPRGKSSDGPEMPTYHGGMATHGAVPDDGPLSALFDSSPDREVHTSAAAELGLLLGLLSVLAAPFSIMHVLSLGSAAVGGLLALAGVVRTSRPDVAGRALAPLGLALCFVTAVLVGLRYLGLDTAFGDRLVPTIAEWLDNLNAHFPQP